MKVDFGVDSSLSPSPLFFLSSSPPRSLGAVACRAAPRGSPLGDWLGPSCSPCGAAGVSSLLVGPAGDSRRVVSACSSGSPIRARINRSSISHARTVGAERVWRQVRQVIPDAGVLFSTARAFPRGRTRWASRDNCGSLGKVANCQVAVTVACGPGRGRGARRRVVSARDVADGGGAATRADSAGRVLPEKGGSPDAARQVRGSGFG